jgi:hypothetical protein
VVIYVLGTLPGWPLGFALFGRRHAAGWIAGGLFGYAVLALTIWAATALGLRSPGGLLVGWLFVTVVVFAVASFLRGPFVALPAWRRGDTLALLVVLLLVPALFWFPYKNLGARDRAGNRYFRAYFTADYLWHVALTGELSKYSQPPVNPYMSPEPLHYYWTYFVVPAAVSRFGPSPLADIEVALKANAMCTAVLFLGAIVIATWCAVPSSGATAVAVLLTVVAASGEGLYSLYRDILLGGHPLSFLRDLNVDALSNWYFRGLRIDGLPRSMWYTPQHSMSVALGLLALPCAGVAARSVSWGAIVLAGSALGASTLFNPLLGGMFSLIYGSVVTALAIRHRAPVVALSHAAAAVPVLGALGWCFANEMVEGAGTTLHFGVAAFARFRPVLTFWLSLGPVLVPGLLGLASLRTMGQHLWPAVAGLIAGIALLYFVVLIAETSYVGFRAGQIIQVSLAPLAAAFFGHLLARGRRALMVLLTVLFVAAGLPTTLVDAYNAQDITNLAQGPAFQWTIVTTPDQQAGFEWVRRNTPPLAVVQMDPIVRARETWTQIPTFARRRMAAGLPISLIDVPSYRHRSALVHKSIYVSTNPDEAWRVARELEIDYIYMDDIERAGLPCGFEDKFESAPHLFHKVYSNGEVRIYDVLER